MKRTINVLISRRFPEYKHTITTLVQQNWYNTIYVKKNNVFSYNIVVSEV